MQGDTAALAVGVLVAEHRQIDRVLTVLEVAARRALAAGGAPDVQLIRAVVDFIERFADGRHHEKEEKVLFAEMHACGVSLSQGPLACMMRQHEVGRRLAAEMRRWAEGDASARALGAAAVRKSALDYAELLRSHIGVEDSALFPSVLARLPRSSLVRVAEAYAALDPPTWREEITAAADQIEELGRAGRALESAARAAEPRGERPNFYSAPTGAPSTGGSSSATGRGGSPPRRSEKPA